MQIWSVDDFGKFISKVKKEEYKIAGQLFDTYIIVEKDEKMLLIDQHAAHERIFYEKLVNPIKYIFTPTHTYTPIY